MCGQRRLPLSEFGQEAQNDGGARVQGIVLVQQSLNRGVDSDGSDKSLRTRLST
jgi:hypothetical protein